MAGMWGMDVDAVRNLATQFQTQAEAVRQVVATLDPLVTDDSIWKGPDADGFRTEWETHKTNLNACVTALDEAGTKANNNAQAQQDTSQSA